MRLERYNRADAYIKEHYKNNPNPDFHVGHNFLSDWTEQEYKTLLGYKPMRKERNTTPKVTAVEAAALPVSVDWRQKGAVNPVKDQGHCGSCWAFATSAILEGAYAVTTGQLLSFSE